MDISKLTISLPIPDDNQIIKLPAGSYRICSVLRASPLYNPFQRSIRDFYVLESVDVLAEQVIAGLKIALADTALCGAIDEAYADSAVMSAIKSSPHIQWISPTDLRYSGRVSIDLPSDSQEERMPISDAQRILDYSTQSVGGSVGLSMYLCHGTAINENGTITSRGEQMARILLDNLVFPAYSRRRMTASNLNAVTRLANGKDPWVHAPSYIEGTLSGVHLVTAATPLYTYKESIAVAESARDKLICKIAEQQVLLVPKAISSFKLEVAVGDIVEPGQIIARHEGTKRLGFEEDVYKASISKIGAVKNIEQIDYSFQGSLYHRIALQYDIAHRISDGDKLVHRNGGKGVVCIVPDSEMPAGVDVCCSPLAILHRRNLGVLVEMMANEKAYKTKDFHAHYNHDELGLIKKLYAEGFGKKYEIKWGNRWMPFYTSQVYWMVLDKFAYKAAGITANKQHTDSFGAPLDGIAGGVRLGLSELHLLSAAKGWGMEIIDDHIGANNSFPVAERAVRDMIVAVRS